MNNIKRFKYANTYELEKCLKDYGYTLDDVKGFSYHGKKQYHGNVFKLYSIWFKDYNEEYFSVVYFKSYNEYKQCALGFNGNKLLKWYESANIRKYKLNID